MKVVPLVLGQPLHLWLGVILFGLILLQIAIARRWVKLPFAWHRRGGYAILALALLHAYFGLGLWLWGFTVR